MSIVTLDYYLLVCDGSDGSDSDSSCNYFLL